ncbi:hypothetical protein GQ53DRAFT_664816, partial [Thozetella sp. PMI_491]
QASESEIKNAFQRGDDDGDDTLSVNEAIQAIEKLKGASLSATIVESGCSSCSIPTTREMDLDEFTSLVRHFESNGTL